MRWTGKVVLIGAVIIMMGLPGVAWAVGTGAGTPIANTASASFTVGGTSFTEDSNEEVITVAEILDVDVTLLTVTANPDNAVTVEPGDEDAVLTFSVTNTGNGSDTYTLAGLSAGFNGSGNDTFDPTLVNLYLDDGTTPGVFDAGDSLYVPGTNDPTIAADAAITIHVLNDIDDPAVDDGDLGESQLTATSNSLALFPPGSVAGAFLDDQGDLGGDLVIGSSLATDAEYGTYLVAALNLTLTKSSVVLDPFGGAEPIPGATVTYTIVAEVTGTGTATAVMVTDPIPVNTTYVAESMTLNTATQTDAVDSPGTDEAFFDGTGNGTISVGLGDLTSASPTQTVTFQVLID